MGRHKELDVEVSSKDIEKLKTKYATAISNVKAKRDSVSWQSFTGSNEDYQRRLRYYNHIIKTLSDEFEFNMKIINGEKVVLIGDLY